MLWGDLIKHHRKIWRYIDGRIDEAIINSPNAPLVEIIHGLKEEFYHNNILFADLKESVCVGCYISKKLYWKMPHTIYTTICDYCPFLLHKDGEQYICGEASHPYEKLLSSISLEDIHKYCREVMYFPFDPRIEKLYKVFINKEEVENEI